MAFKDAPKCTAHKTNGDPCPQPAMIGQSVCQSHGGKSKQALAKAQERIKEQQAEKALVKFKGLAGERLQIPYTQAMLWMVEETAQNVLFYQDQIRQLRQGKGAKNEAGEWEEGLYRYIPEVGDMEHLWVRKYDQERDRLFKMAIECAKYGLEEKVIELRQKEAEAYMQAQIASWDALGLNAEQRQLAANSIQGSLRKFRVIEGTG
jgi:hypothetical protein